MRVVHVLLVAMALACTAAAQTNDAAARLRALEDGLGHLDAKLTRQLNEVLWTQRLGDVAVVDNVRYPGPAPRRINGDVTAAVVSNSVIVSALTFLPRQQSHWRKMPMIVLVHGEVHGNVTSDEEAHVVRELVEQGYAVIAPDYRGSSGYGAEFWRQIDYGGLEVEDVHAARQWMLERHHSIDPKRVGIMGWSHGGMIALLAIFAHPESYQACYAGVPVSDLEERIRIRGKDYEQLFAAPYHLGKTFAEDPEEYRRRSPVTHAARLRVPLLVHANTSDEDVTANEIGRFIGALEAAGKDFQYRIYTNAPGGHHFNRIDTALARESRREIWSFLGEYLKPPLKPKTGN